MTDTNKGKVASLTGSLLARKGAATPAGFTRVHAGEIDPSAPATPIGAHATPDGTAGDQPALILGGGSREDKDGGAEEGWAPLSQIVIRPHPFVSREPPPAPVPEAPAAITPFGDIGIDPSLLVSPALMLPVTPQESARSERVTVETPVVSPVLQHNEPILVVPRAQLGVGEEFDDGAPAQVDKSEYEELPAPTLGPAIRDWGADHEARENVSRAAPIRLDPILEPNTRPPANPQAGEPAETVAQSVDELPATPGVERDLPEPIVLPKPAPVLAPAVARGRTSRTKVAKPNVMPPIRIGELQARARVIPTRTRRRRRIGPVIFAMLALAIFLGVTWQAYRTSRDNAGAVADVGPNGEPTIWATVDELGYAVSQIFAALAGRRGPKGEEGSRLAGGAGDTPPPATFVPASPVGTPEQLAGRGVAGAAPAPGDIDDGLVETEPVAAEAEPGPEPTVVAARPTSPVRLPAPPVPVAPVDRAETIAAAPQPVGVTAPPPPPLNIDNGVDGGIDSATASPGLEEVDSAIALEPLATAAVAVAAGVGSDDNADDNNGVAVPSPVGEIEAVAGAEVSEGLASAAPAPNAATQVATIPPDSAPAGGLDSIGLEGAGVPVLKPAVRSQQQSLGGAGGADASGTENGRSSDVDGYAVQLSSLRTRAQAEREHDRLRGDYPTLLREVELLVSEGSVSNRGTFFRILTSRFEDAGAAQVLCRSLRDRGQDCLVVRR